MFGAVELGGGLISGVLFMIKERMERAYGSGGE